MEDRTLDIIHIIKYYGTMAETYIARYMNLTCLTPIGVYTRPILTGIVKNAFLDYIRNVPASQSVVLMINYFDSPGDDLTRMMLALGMCRVKEKDGEYIQGFRDTGFDFSRLDKLPDK